MVIGGPWGGGGGTTAAQEARGSTPTSTAQSESERKRNEQLAIQFNLEKSKQMKNGGYEISTKNESATMQRAFQIQQQKETGQIVNSAGYNVSGGLSGTPTTNKNNLPSSTKATTGTLTAAPTSSQKFSSSINQAGFIKGSLGFASSEIGIGFSKLQQAGSKIGFNSPYFNTESMNKIVSSAPYLSYITPAAPVLMLIGGSESVIKSPTITGKLLGGAEASLGGFGSALQINSLKSLREATALESAPTSMRTIRFEGAKGGIDYNFGLKQTIPSGMTDKLLNIKPQTAITQIRQPYFNTQTGSIMESGKGVSFLLKGDKINAALFETSGTSTRLINSPQRISNLPGLRTSFPLNAEASAGKININNLANLQGTAFKVNRLESLGGDFISISGKTTQGTGKTSNWFGGASQGLDSGIVNILGGKANKLRLNLNTGQKSFLVKPNTGGQMKIFNMPEKSNFFFTGTKSTKTIPSDFSGINNNGNGLVLLTKTTSPSGYQNTLIEQGLKQVSPSVSQVSAITKPSSMFPLVSASTKTMQLQETKQKNIFGNLLMQSNAQQTKQSTIQVQMPKQKNILTSLSSSSFSFAQPSTTKTLSSFGYAQPTAQATRQIQKSSPGFRTPTMPGFNITPMPNKIVPIIPLWLPTPGFYGGLKSRMFRGKQPKKYTPSYGVIAGLTKGRNYAGKRLTGLESRGYTKGFSWAYNNPSFKFKNINLRGQIPNFNTFFRRRKR